MVSCTHEVNPASSSMAFLWEEKDLLNTQMGYDFLQYYAHVNLLKLNTGDERQSRGSER